MKTYGVINILSLFFTFHLACAGFAFSSEASLSEALSLMSQKRDETALKALTEIITLSSDEKQKGRAYFLRGKIFKKQARYAEARASFEMALSLYPVLSDYIRLELARLYSSSEDYDKALEMAQVIESPPLEKEALLITIDALAALNRNDEAIDKLSVYTQSYKRDKQQQYRLAMLYKSKGNNVKAIETLKGIYIAARGLSSKSHKALQELHFRGFTTEELKKRGDNLLKMAAFKAAESTYREALRTAPLTKKNDVRFALAMCQFKTKRYSQSAGSFAALNGPEPLFWRARSLYRIDRLTEFKMVLDEFGRRYSTHEKYGFLLLSYAQELMRRHEFIEARENLKKVADNFPDHSEDALWSLGWSYYKDKQFKKGAEYFSRLTSQIKGKNLDRYLYWEARSLEKSNSDSRVYMKLKNNGGYYGYLARARMGIDETPLTIPAAHPSQPRGKQYAVIDELILLNMDSDALDEISHAVDSAQTDQEFLYLASESLKMNNYPKTISIGRKITGNEGLHYAYPKGFWSIIKREAQRRGVDPYLVLAIIREESRFNRRAISPAGARGLMQLMPKTAQKEKRKAKVTIRSKADLLMPGKNITLGIVHLSSVLAYYNNRVPFAIASYNAGKVPVNGWIKRSRHESLDEFIEDISYRETRNYVKTVLLSYWQYGKISGEPPRRKTLMAIIGPWIR